MYDNVLVMYGSFIKFVFQIYKNDQFIFKKVTEHFVIVPI